jgi:hypothetical protein
MKYLWLIPALWAFCACREGTSYPYTIRDFPNHLRPYLTAIIREGVIGSKNEYAIDSLHSLASDATIIKMTRSEHPLLRSVALSIATHRDHPDHYKIMMDHLDDTARVSWYFQCLSYPHVMVSDYLIWRYEWKTEADKNKTIDKLIRQHNYLEAAYQALNKTSVSETYYPFIRQMAMRETDMRIRSFALRKLADFKKQEDLGLLHDIMRKNIPYLDYNCFSIMADHPDSTYQQLLIRFSRQYYRKWCDGSAERFTKEDNLKCFLHTLASFKSKESADILKRYFYNKPFLPCSPPDSTMVREILYQAICDNNCSWYDEMAAIAKKYLEKKKEEEEKMTGYLEPLIPEPDTLPVRINWYN